MSIPFDRPADDGDAHWALFVALTYGTRQGVTVALPIFHRRSDRHSVKKVVLLYRIESQREHRFRATFVLTMLFRLA